jgi:uncharacterized protein HemX
MTGPGPDGRDGLAERYGAALDRLLAAESEATRALARARVAERDAEEARRLVDERTREVARRDEEIDRLRREVARRAEELARCSTALESVVGSASWRVTRPLRRLTGSTRPERA